MWYGKDENGISVSSGIYMYRKRAGEFSATRKMLLVRWPGCKVLLTLFFEIRTPINPTW
jgi:hypothetical protein